MSKFQVGNSFGKQGRPKGIKDKRHDYYDVMAKLQKKGHDPIEAFIELAKDPHADPVLRFKANQELASRVSPSVKAIEQRIEIPAAEDLRQLGQIMDELLAKHRKEY